jgi:hypothetical protein
MDPDLADVPAKVIHFGEYVYGQPMFDAIFTDREAVFSEAIRVGLAAVPGTAAPVVAIVRCTNMPGENLLLKICVFWIISFFFF